jgi:hypothetical protein
MSWDELAQERDEAQALTRPVNYDYLDLIKPKYSYLRQYTPTFLNEMKFQSNHAASSVLEAVEIIKEMNQSKKRRVPEDAPLDFLPDRWHSYVVDEQGDLL